MLLVLTALMLVLLLVLEVAALLAQRVSVLVVVALAVAVLEVAAVEVVVLVDWAVVVDKVIRLLLMFYLFSHLLVHNNFVFFVLFIDFKILFRTVKQLFILFFI